MARVGQNSDYLPIGTKLSDDGFEVKEFLSEGGFGLTYLTEDSSGQRFVIKECFPKSICRRQDLQVGVRSASQKADFERLVRVFVREARKLARLSHPNIVQIRKAFAENGTAYMLMDYIDGQDLLTGVTEKKFKFSPAQIVQMTNKLLSALSYVHEQDILHRDVSPDNILINQAGDPVLIDFGAAKENHSTSDNKNSGEVQIVKENYSPQEFHLEDAEQLPASDLYGLAATLYLLITKKAPVTSALRTSEIAQQKADPYQPLTGRFNGYPKGFLEMIDKSMAVFAKDRPQSAEEWFAGYEQAADSKKARSLGDFGGEAIKGPGLGVYAGLAGFAVLIGAGIFLYQLNGSEPTSISEPVLTPLERAVQDVETGNVQPDIQDVAPEATPVDVATQPLDFTIGDWLFDFPLTVEAGTGADGNEVFKVTALDAESDSDLVSALPVGTDIVSINDRLPISYSDPLAGFMASLVEGRSVPVQDWSAQIRLPESSEVQSVSFAPDYYRAGSLGTATLAQRAVGDSWQIIVLDAGEGETGLEVGDVFVADLLSQVDLNRYESISFMIDRLVDRKASSAIVRVLRDGEEATVSLPFARLSVEND